MNFHFNFHNVRFSAALRRHVEQRMARLEDITDEIFAARVVVLERACGTGADTYCVQVHLAVAGNDIHASNEGGSLWASIDDVGLKLARQLRKRKTRLLEHRHRAPCPEGEP